MEWMRLETKAGMVNRGKLSRLFRCMERAQAREKLTIAFIGGSITQGSLASAPETCYAYLVYQWWQMSFPKTQFVYVNAGVGGTTSQFGAARVQEDLLVHKPDFVIVEFSVNDENTDHFKETYEGLIRNIYGDKHMPAVLPVCNVRYDDGTNAQDMHLDIAKAYNLPVISMKEVIYPKVASGEIPVRTITPDDLHPNDKGHQLVADVITKFLDYVRGQYERGMEWGGEEDALMPAPITENGYEYSVRYQSTNYNAECEGFIPDRQVSRGNPSLFTRGWFAGEAGERILFRIRATAIAVQYRKSVRTPAPVARVVIDGDMGNAKILDSNFNKGWGDCLYIDTIAEHMENTEHTVEITIIDTGEKAEVPFYLASVIGSRNQKR